MVSRKSQPFPTQPCFDGGSPVSIVAWDVSVTAGIGLVQGRPLPSSEIRGACAMRAGVRPTTFRTTIFLLGTLRSIAAALERPIYRRSRRHGGAEVRRARGPTLTFGSPSPWLRA